MPLSRRVKNAMNRFSENDIVSASLFVLCVCWDTAKYYELDRGHLYTNPICHFVDEFGFVMYDMRVRVDCAFYLGWTDGRIECSLVGCVAMVFVMEALQPSNNRRVQINNGRLKHQRCSPKINYSNNKMLTHSIKTAFEQQ